MPRLKKMTKKEMLDADLIKLSSTKKSVVTYKCYLMDKKYINEEQFYKIDEKTRKMLDEYDPYILNREKIEKMYH